MGALPPPHAGNLDQTLRTAFDLLCEGAADRRSALHTLSLATLGQDGAPRLRVLVLRGFDADGRSLRLHTDSRADKAAELRADPRAAVLLYDPARRVQLRIEGLVSMHTDDATADAGWAASRAMSRMTYAGAAPGEAVPAPPPAPQDATSGRPHFAVLQLRFDRLEWLWLAAAGHQRARFTWAPAPHAEWLAP